MKKHIKLKELFNKKGLTYVELLVALALLALIVVSFTPMLLTSYESLYKAGEKTEALYSSQQQIEDGLAVRSSTDISQVTISFKKNTEVVFENINVAGRKIVSSLQQGLETLFYGVRARIDIISSDIVNDDQSHHDVILQTTGLAYDSVTTGKYSGDIADLPQNQIHIDAFIPDKDQETGTTTDEVVYSTTRANFSNLSYDSQKGRISFTLSGSSEKLDFTQSPVKILVYYKNERGHLKTLVDYLYIEPPTIIAAGSTNAHDYYTTAGVQQIDASTDNETQVTKYVLNVEGRDMRLVNSGYLTAADRPYTVGATINTITWVNQDENTALKPYYVMAGTNGRVYRMYRYDMLDITPQSVLGANNSITNTKDAPYDILDGRRVYQDFWSGEMSDQYYFRTQGDGMGYGATSDNKKDCSAETQYNAINKNLKYLMIYSGCRTGYSYRMQASRRISYVLTEAGSYSFRLAGKKAAPEDFAGYTAVWEPNNDTYRYLGSGKRVSFGLFDYRTVAGSGKNNPGTVPVYFYNKTLGSENDHYETNIAWISAMSYTSVDPYSLDRNSGLGYDFFYNGFFYTHKGDSDLGGEGKTITNHLQTSYSNTANITSAVFLEGAGSNGQGQVVYFGAVPAYSLLRQSSDIGKDDQHVYNGENIRNSRATAFYIHSNGYGNATNIYKHARRNDNDMGGAHDAMKAGTGIVTLTDAATFYTSGNNDTTYMYAEPNLEFTFGYCSRWRMTVGDVTYNGTKEECKSYEKYYIASHDGEGYDMVPVGGLNTGTTDNLYYNVWFPGEHYTLLQTATCDEVTVACGYTVSGSTFMEQSSVVGGYYGTALGSVYNDGVISAYTSSGHSYTLDASKGGQTTIFQNVLYYKSPNFVNGTIHSRQSIRFEKIGLNAETTKTSDTTGTKNYYAYFSDNYGKVYRALVATANVSSTGSGDEAAASETVSLRRVKDTELQEITVNGKTMNQLFSEITAINATNDIVIITGTPVAGYYNTAVVGTKDAKNNWTWKEVYLGGFKGEVITSSFIVGGYYYVGVYDPTKSSQNKWLGAVNLETLKTTGNKIPLTPYANECAVDDGFLYAEVDDILYAIGGRETN